MFKIYFNVSGTPTDIPRIFDDTPRFWFGMFELENKRCVFTLADDANGGGHLQWDGNNVNFLFPAEKRGYEAAELGLPPLVYKPKLEPLWPVRGATEFNLPAKMRAGEDIRPILRQRKAAGANLVRSLSMGFPFRGDQHPLTMEEAERYWQICAEEGLYVLWCVFAGTRTVMPSPSQQQAHWEQTKARAAGHSNVLLQLANEWNHSTQSIDPRPFSPSSANICDHGPGLTDAHPVEPFWSLVTWHPRRDGTRGITNYDCYEFEAEPWPRSQPWIPGEGPKPEDYGFNPEYARQMANHCGINWGGIFHSNEGVRSDPWPGSVQTCAEAFYRALTR